MKALGSFLVVVALAVAVFFLGRLAQLRLLLGVIVPYAAVATFLVGVSYRVVRWSLSPVPFRIPTTCGQQKSLPWIKLSWLDNPYRTSGVIFRMLLEILFFRSLFRNTKVELRQGPRLIYGENKFLWLGALAFHWSFLIIFLRHLRFFTEPVPAWVTLLDKVDSFFQIGAPILYVTDVVIIVALLYLLQRRLADPQVRYISLLADYFALFLILRLAVSGIWMRYFTRVDIVAIKQLAIGLVTFSPIVPKEVGSLFFVHLFLLSTLAAYFPFSKLMHLGGVFLSPTRNLANNSRMQRHINPWDYPVKVHTYQEWEAEFHDKIEAAGLPLEK
jgi:[DsrC]-trisulfide reductase subunit M